MSMDDTINNIVGDKRNKIVFVHIDDRSVFFIVSERTIAQLSIPSVIDGRNVGVVVACGV